jgi:hypothetical protein
MVIGFRKYPGIKIWSKGVSNMDEKNSLYILWTNADMDTSLRMVMMYATNSMIEHWWEDVTVIMGCNGPACG